MTVRDISGTLDPRQILQPRLLEGVINKKLEQNLDFHKMFPRIWTEALSFAYFEDTTSAGDDIAAGRQAMPSPLMELGEMDTIETTNITVRYGGMQRFGYGLNFTKRQFREDTFVDEFNRAIDRAVFGIARKMNNDIIHAIRTVNFHTIQSILKQWKG